MKKIRTLKTFPDNNIPSSEKDEDYHREYITAICNNSITKNTQTSIDLIQQSYEYFTNTHKGNEDFFLQTSENGESLPAEWISYNSITPKIKTLVGEAISRGYKIDVVAINKSARAERLEKKFDMLGQMYIKNDLMDLEDQTGLPSAPTEELPETKEELEHWMKDYRDLSEKVVNACLEDLRNRLHWDVLRMYLYRDLFVAGRIFCKTYLKEGRPFVENIDARHMIFDGNSRCDFLSDSTYFGKFTYIPLSDLIQLYNLNKEEIDEIKASIHSSSAWFDKSSNSINGTAYSYVIQDNSGLKVLVLDAEWLDFKEVKRKKSVDKFGNVHWKKVKNNAKGKDIYTRKIKTWRKGTLIGGLIIKEWGEVENIPRSCDDINEIQSNYTALLPDYVNYTNTSMSQMIEKIQKTKDIVMYNLQLAVNRAGSKGFFYDTSLLPDKWELDDVLSKLKTSGIALYNGARFGGANATPFKEFDLTISNSINQYLSILQYLESEMQNITSINAARQGMIEGASQAVGVTENALVQSSLATLPDFKKFDEFQARVFTKLANLCKISYLDEEIFSLIIGDLGVDYIKESLDLHLKDFSVYIKTIPSTLNDKSELKQLVMASIQTGGISITDAIDIIAEDDIDVMRIKLKRSIEEKEQRQMQMQHESQMQQQQAKAQTDMQLQQMKDQNISKEEQAKAERQSMIEQQRQSGKEQLARANADLKLRNESLK